MKSITAQTPTGQPVPFEHKLSPGTLSITHDGLPDGVLLTVVWR